VPNVEVLILVPEERLAEFYRLYGDWLEGEKPQTAATPSSTRRKGRAKRAEAKRASRGGLGRYEPLVAYLAQQAEEEQGEVELDFARVEAILGAELPRSARSHRAWWANTASNARAAGWMDAGWKVTNLDLEGERVRFERSS
jgi:hypothetical protein